MFGKSSLKAALDVGSNSTKIVVCRCNTERTRDSLVEVLGYAEVPSEGVRRGSVVNYESASKSIRACLESVEESIGFTIDSVFASLSGTHIKTVSSSGTVPVKTGEVTLSVVKEAVDAAKAVFVPKDQEVIHIVPQQFIVDDKAGIKEPVGMQATRFQAKIDILTTSASATENLVKAINASGTVVQDVILAPIASGSLLLSDEEKNEGVALVDVGGGTSDLVVFADGIPILTQVFSIAGNSLTNKIAASLGIGILEAEALKLEKAVLSKVDIVARASSTIGNQSHIRQSLTDTQVIGETREGRNKSIHPSLVTSSTLYELLYPEIYSLLEDIKQTFFSKGVKVQKIIFTGGSAKLRGLTTFAENILGIPSHVRFLSWDSEMGCDLTRKCLRPDIEDDGSLSLGGVALGSVLFREEDLLPPKITSKQYSNFSWRPRALVGGVSKWISEHF
jgi:cell division protein FtsA